MLANSEKYVDSVLSHLCSKLTYGDVAEWCEMRHDCSYVVTCPDCGQTFTLNDEEYELLVRRSEQVPQACGIQVL